ncbi:MAG: hypothetical protein R3213_01910 [Flavobacteriaceae bacterium]|nr:hypothetical protein [Flavobacteriaceae bacterium]
MKRTIYYPSLWQALTMPYAMEWSAKLENNGMPIKELTLENPHANDLGICQMDLNITKFTAIDDKGIEHEIMKFPDSSMLSIKGMSDSFFIKTKTLSSLKPANYDFLRFYIERNESSFTYSDGIKEDVNKFDFIDFKIQSGLTIKEEEEFQAKLWFDFPSYQFSWYFKPLVDWFKNFKKTTTNLAKA